MDISKKGMIYTILKINIFFVSGFAAKYITKPIVNILSAIRTKKFKLDVTKLSDITVEAVALNYPGLIRQGNLPAPIYIEKVTDGNIKYDNTYVALGLNIDFKDSIITDTFNVNIIHGHDNKNNRSRTVNINKSNLVDFKTLYVIE